MSLRWSDTANGDFLPKFKIPWLKQVVSMLPKISLPELRMNRSKIFLLLYFTVFIWWLDIASATTNTDEASLSTSQDRENLKLDIARFFKTIDFQSSTIGDLQIALNWVNIIIRQLEFHNMHALIWQYDLYNRKKKLISKIDSLQAKNAIENLKSMNWKIVRLTIPTGSRINVIISWFRTVVTNGVERRISTKKVKRHWIFEWKLNLYSNRKRAEIILDDWTIAIVYNNLPFVAKNIVLIKDGSVAALWDGDVISDNKNTSGDNPPLLASTIHATSTVNQGKIHVKSHPVPKAYKPLKKVSKRIIWSCDKWLNGVGTKPIIHAANLELKNIIWKLAYDKLSGGLWKMVEFDTTKTKIRWTLTKFDEKYVYITISHNKCEKLILGTVWLATRMTLVEETTKLKKYEKPDVILAAIKESKNGEIKVVEKTSYLKTFTKFIWDLWDKFWKLSLDARTWIFGVIIWLLLLIRWSRKNKRLKSNWSENASWKSDTGVKDPVSKDLVSKDPVDKDPVGKDRLEPDMSLANLTEEEMLAMLDESVFIDNNEDDSGYLEWDLGDPIIEESKLTVKVARFLKVLKRAEPVNPVKPKKTVKPIKAVENKPPVVKPVVAGAAVKPVAQKKSETKPVRRFYTWAARAARFK